MPNNNFSNLKNNLINNNSNNNNYRKNKVVLLINLWIAHLMLLTECQKILAKRLM